MGHVFLATAGLLDLDLSFVAEVITFVAMILILGRWVYPRVVAAAGERQRRITEELEAARRLHIEVEARLNEVESQLAGARAQAADVIAGARRSAAEIRADARDRATAEMQRVAEGARREIEAERLRSLEWVRGHVADLVVLASEKVIGETLNEDLHQQLIDHAIEAVGTGDSRA